MEYRQREDSDSSHRNKVSEQECQRKERDVVEDRLSCYEMNSRKIKGEQSRKRITFESLFSSLIHSRSESMLTKLN